MDRQSGYDFGALSTGKCRGKRPTFTVNNYNEDGEVIEKVAKFMDCDQQ